MRNERDSTQNYVAFRHCSIHYGHHMGRSYLLQSEDAGAVQRGSSAVFAHERNYEYEPTDDCQLERLLIATVRHDQSFIQWSNGAAARGEGGAASLADGQQCVHLDELHEYD
ncbi:hypothetical protein D3C84_995680 [compost metagenome]